MGEPGLKRQSQKSIIAARNILLNIGLLIFILILTAVVTFAIIYHINNNNAADIVGVNSKEAAQLFYTYISEDLSLVKKLAHSKPIINWYASENDRQKRTSAGDELMSYFEILSNPYFFLIVDSSGNEYSIDSQITPDELIPEARLDLTNEADAWYLDCINSGNDYTLRFDLRNTDGTWRIWINHKVVLNGKVVGVVCSGLDIPDIFENMTGVTEIGQTKGYIIDSKGKIQSDRLTSGNPMQEDKRNIRDVYPDPAFAEKLSFYLAHISGFFGNDSPQEIFKLANSPPYNDVAIKPIPGTDWSVVVFFSSSLLHSVRILLPLIFAMLAALLLYVAASNAFMYKFIHTPLYRLTQSVFRENTGSVKIFGADRDDEIGELARSIRDATNELLNQKRLLHAVNNASAVMFASADYDDIDSSLLDGMGIIARCIDIDRIIIWQNETIDGIGYYVNRNTWQKDPGLWKKPVTLRRAYSENPELERKFANNEYVNGPVSSLSEPEQRILGEQGMKSTMAIPMFMQGKMFGFISFDDCHREHTFTDDELEILRSAGLLIANALNRNEQAQKLIKAHEYNKQMMGDIEQRNNLLDISNRAAAILLSATSEAMFGVSIIDGMKLIGHSVDVDRVYIWQNERRDGELYFVKRYEWASDLGAMASSITSDTGYPYSVSPDWENIFSRGGNINGPLYSLAEGSRKFLELFGVKSILLIPVQLQDQFWGFIGFDDCRRERYFSEDEVNILRSVGLMMVNALNRGTQAELIREAYSRSRIILDAMPLSTVLWDEEFNIMDCNEEALRLFGIADKKDFMTRFFDYSPEYQNDGQRSRERVFNYLKKAVEDERVVFEWMHQTADGTPIPSEVTLTKVKLDEKDVIASYVRDLRETKQMLREIEQRDFLLNVVNNAAGILLQSEYDVFENVMHQCMGMLGRAIGANLVKIWKNYIMDRQLCSTMLFEWMEGSSIKTGPEYSKDILYSAELPQWSEILSRGDCINNVVSSLSPIEQMRMAPQGILSVCVMPMFVRNEFWGFIGFYDSNRERLFSQDELSILRSATMLIANSLLRQDVTMNIRATAAKLEGVIQNYMGIIWCIDKNNVITLFSGQYMHKLGLSPVFMEGKRLDTALDEYLHFDIFGDKLESIAKEPQDWQTENNGTYYQIRTAPIYDAGGNLVNIVGSIDDITEKVELQNELETALVEAQEANQAKSRFLTSMSHEMRTPLNAIIGLSELSLESKNLSWEDYSYLDSINNAGKTLLGTVNDILDISKIESGKMELNPVEYSLPSLLNDTITQSIVHSGDKPVEFVLDINENLPSSLYGDDLRVKQIFINLLSNAFKYTEEGTVELSLKCIGDMAAAADTVWLVARVSDTGIGIKKEEIDNLFVDFTRMDVMVNRKIEGTGLGLPIAKKVAALMDGSISVESEYGKGSTFTVQIRQGFVNNSVIGAEVASRLKNFSYLELQPGGTSPLKRCSLPYARVLVVDDVTTNLDVAKGMLKPYGMQIDCVTSGQRAVDRIRDEKVKYNAIFMDHMMPGMDGIEATRMIREEIGTEYARTIPIIALTANAIVGNEEMFLSNGFQAFISKPINIGRLDAVIREWVRDAEQEKAPGLVNIDGQMLPNVRSGLERRVYSDRRSGVDRRIIGGDIAGLDIQKGITLFGGAEESYFQVLRSYMVNTRPLLESLKKVTSDNLAEYAVTVHGIKGASRGICADILGAKAEALEKAAKEENFDFVSKNNNAFIRDAERLISSLNGMFNQIALGSPKPKKARPDAELLSKLAAACETYKMDEVDSVMGEIEQYDYENDDGFAVWLRKNVDLLNFNEIKDRINYG